MTKLPSMINHRSRATTNRQFWIVIIVGILGGCLVTFHNKIANAFRFPVYGQKPKLSLSSPLFMALSREKRRDDLAIRAERQHHQMQETMMMILTSMMLCTVTKYDGNWVKPRASC
jgi:hypothetical protein